MYLKMLTSSGEAVSPRRGRTEETPKNSAPYSLPRSSPPEGRPSSSSEEMAQRGRFTQESNKKNHSSPEMTGIIEQWMLHLSLLGKFPTEALIFLPPVMRRSKKSKGKKEDIVPKFLPKLPLFLP